MSTVMDRGPWKLTIQRVSDETTHEIHVSFPQKLSIVGLKNLIQEITGVLPKDMHLFLPIDNSPVTRGRELQEISDRKDVLFLRDYYPMLKNGTVILLDMDSDNYVNNSASL